MKESESNLQAIVDICKLNDTDIAILNYRPTYRNIWERLAGCPYWAIEHLGITPYVAEIQSAMMASNRGYQDGDYNGNYLDDFLESSSDDLAMPIEFRRGSASSMGQGIVKINIHKFNKKILPRYDWEEILKGALDMLIYERTKGGTLIESFVKLKDAVEGCYRLNFNPAPSLRKLDLFTHVSFSCDSSQPFDFHGEDFGVVLAMDAIEGNDFYIALQVYIGEDMLEF